MACPGKVEIISDTQMRAHFQRRAAGRKEHIRGPRRGEKRRAEQDLELIRAAAEKEIDPWHAMSVEAHRLQERAEYEAQVTAIATSISSQTLSTESQPDDSQCFEDTLPLTGYDDDDADCTDSWPEIDDEGRLPADYVGPPLIEVAKPKDPLEATALLSKFRPARMSKQDLVKLLDARADPNITPTGDVHPLMKVMTFANHESVGPMREALLSAGAIEDEEAKERWEIRKLADACEVSWMRSFYHDPR